MEGEIWKPIAEVSSPHCPRCASTNTKFCYYNNYSLTQPRYFCKACRRYWTKGGSLRNVPVGGGCRRNKTTPTKDHKSSLRSSNAHHRVSFKNSSSNSTLVEQHTISSSSIDLAVVYANFLNHHQSSTSTDINIPSNDSKDNYFCQHRIQETSTDNGLPPLPTTELSSSSSSSTWMNSQVMVSGHNPVQPIRFSNEDAQDFGIIVDEWIPYDLPNCDAFPPGL